jgi:photosystem II stability/assembly factor-like uncharacterized protein
MHMLFGTRGRAWTAAALTAALTLIAGASAGVNTPHSGWYSGNPLLGPSHLADLVCAGTTCYASGTFGTLLKSTDGGASWEGIVTGLTLDLRRVRLAGSADRIVVGGGCSLRRSDDGGNTFERLPFTASDAICPSALAAFTFASSGVGYLALANGSVLSTADGGRTFSRRTPVPSGTVTDLLCTSETTCFAGTANGQIQRTNDGAVSWGLVAQIGVQLNGLEQADANTLYAVGQAGVAYKSIDSGATWERRVVTGVPTADLMSIRCTGSDTCLIATRDGSRVVRTADGGETFTSAVAPAESAFAVELATATRGLAVGRVGNAVVSDDAGGTWRLVGSRLTDEFTVLEAATDRIAYAAGRGGALARTTDSGQSWANVSPPSSVGIQSIAAPTGTRLFVLAEDGTLQRSDNGGSSYALLNTGTPVAARDVVATDAQHVLLVGLLGIRRSVDGGDTFTSVSDRDLRGARLFGAETAGSRMFAYGARRLLYSPNGGLSWRRLRLPGKRQIADASFVSTQTGYLLDRGGYLWRTQNGGGNWVELIGVGRRAVEVDFSDARNGYAVIGSFARRGNGFVLRTTDGGATWRPQLVSPVALTKVDTAAQTAYVLADANYLYATTSGGDVGAARTLRIFTRGRRLASPTTITVSGKLTPAVSGEQAVVTMRAGNNWSSQVATVAANGTFFTRWRVTRRSLFVAQVLGTADHAAAATKPLSVDRRKRPMPRSKR